jgi:hypothetical protein
MVEITVADPELGAVFYSLSQEKTDRPRFMREGGTCLLCHSTSRNQGVPGHLIQSVYADAEGQPNRGMGIFRIDNSTPLERRWGGWYVTGSTGRQVHLGNRTVDGPRKPTEKELAETSNLPSLADKFPAGMHLTPHSDVIALLVMEHQAEMHNRFTRANFSVRQAIFEAEQSKKSAKPNPRLEEETRRRIEQACEPVVRGLLFCDDAPLIDQVRGSSDFAKEFTARGRRDAKGRSLRDFDLERRLFKYPCSYMIETELFAALPSEAHAVIDRRLDEVLSGQSTEPAFKHLSASDRQAIREILPSARRRE